MSQTSNQNDFSPQSPWLDLVNSEQWDGFGALTDHLADPRWVRAFLTRWGYGPGSLDPGAAIAALAPLRRLLRGSAERLTAARRLSRTDVAKLNAFMQSEGRIQISEKDEQLSAGFVPRARDWAWVAGQICLSYVEALKDPERIKICPNIGCKWAFVDRTKANIRKWCNDRSCSNRDRQRRARARLA